MRTGRPTDYTPELAEKICKAVSAWPGSLLKLCRERDDFPNQDTIYDWIRKKKDFSDMWWSAKELQANVMGEDILATTEEMAAIADESEYDLSEDGQGRSIVNTEHIQRSKLRVDARDKAIAHKKFIMARIGPRRWANKAEEAKESGTTHEEILQGLK